MIEKWRGSAVTREALSTGGCAKSKSLSVCGVLGEGLANPVQDERVFGSICLSI
jgi:hypothetical protein